MPANRLGFILGSVFALVRKWFDGAGWFVGLAVALFTFALLAVFLTLQSSDSVLWTGQHVTGTEQGGIVYYRWDGNSYSLDAQGNGSSNAVSVYLDPGNPSHAVIDSAFGRAVAVLLIGVPVAGGVVLLILGGTRNYRWARRNAKRASEFRYLAHLRGRRLGYPRCDEKRQRKRLGSSGQLMSAAQAPVE